MHRSERLRRVINKRVSKDDLIRTVTAAYSQGWRRMKVGAMPWLGSCRALPKLCKKRNPEFALFTSLDVPVTRP